MLSLKNKRFRGDFIAFYNFLRTGTAEGSALMFCLPSSERRYGSGSKLYQERFRLDVKRDFFSKRVGTGAGFVER